MPTTTKSLAHRNAVVDLTAARFNGGTIRVLGSGSTVLAELDPLPTPAFPPSTTGSTTRTFEALGVATGAPVSFVLASADGTETRTGSAGAVGSGALLELADLESGNIPEGRAVDITYTLTDS